MSPTFKAALAALIALAPAAALAAAKAPPPPHHKDGQVLVCTDVSKKATKGTVIGAVGGGVLGNVIAGSGSRTAGTLIGAGVGAVAGHEIAKNKAKKNQECHYETPKR